MSPEDIDAIAEKITTRFIQEKRVRWVDPETHEAHHNWIKRKISFEEEKRTMRRRVIESALIWALPLALTFIGLAVFRHLKHLLVAT